VVWFRLPRRPDDSDQLMGARFGRGHFMVMLPRPDDWQCGYVIPKGGYQRLRSDGLGALRQSIAELVPEFAGRVDTLVDWHQLPLLSVASDRLTRWYRPGLLLIGDAAHTMSPVGGVGINYAIRDAVVAAGVLAEPLLQQRPRLRDLRAIQRRCEWPVRIIQTFQTLAQNQILGGPFAAVATGSLPLRLRLLARTPLLRDLPARLVAFGIWPVHVRRT
jgi:2-polyprenyl-6-methoxyphenol hydroxylase-like FAD-dependent oxidoreductase